MKILQIIQRPQLRGAEIFACQLAMELQKHGVEVDLVYLFGEKESDWPFPSLKMRYIGAKRGKRFWDFGAYKRLADIIKKDKYDLVQANAADTLKYAVMSKRIFGLKCPLVYRNANKMSDFFSGFFHRKLNQWLLSQCNYYISVSEKCRIDLLSIVKKAEDCSVTIPIGTHLFDEQEAFQNRSGDDPVFINIGSLVPEKNHFFLIDIFHCFFVRHKKGQLWIVGDGRLRHELEEKTKSLGLANNIKFWGYRTDVISILKSGSAMLMPSKIEGLPAVILEAMSCRIPVIASDVGGISEVISHGHSGFCISSWNVEDYLTALEFVAFNKKGTQEVIINARKFIESKYLIKDIAGLFIGRYNQMVNA